MKHLSILFFLLFSSLVGAAEIPTETFFKPADISSVRISPDGKHLLSTVESDGSTKLAVIDLKTMQAKHFIGIYQQDRVIFNYGWLNNERVYYDTAIKVGPLARPRFTGYVFAQNIDGTKRMQLLPTKGRRGKKDELPSFWGLLNRLPKEEKYVLISLTSFRAGSYTSAYRLNVYSGHKTRVIKSPAKGAQLTADANGHVKISRSRTDDGKTINIHIRTTKNSDWELFKSFEERKSKLRILGFANGGDKVYVATTRKEGRGIYSMNLKDKAFKFLKSLEGDAAIDRSVRYGNEIAGVTRMPGFYETIFFDESHLLAKIHSSLSASFKYDEISFVNFTEKRDKGIIRVWSDRNPGDLYLFDMKKFKMRPLVTVLPWIKRKQMASMEPISFKARDGVEIRGYLTLPPGKSKNLPLIVNVHGGPYGVADRWTYNREVQFFASRGYAVLQVNYRGSGGRGPSFIYDSYLKMGKEMQDDVTDGTLWAVKQGYADKDRLCIYGASYGGYAAIMGAAKEPDLYKCTVGYVGVYDIELQKKSDTWERESGRQFVRDAWGIDDPKFVKERSPLYHAHKIKAATMLVHGAKDPRVPVDHMYKLQKAFDELKHPYETIIEPHEGHGFADEKNQIKLYNKLDEFFTKHIGS